MPLELNELEDLKDYIDSFPSIPIFYRLDETGFTILAGKLSWKGLFTVDGAKNSGDLEAWLIERNGKKVRGWKELESLFA